TLPLHLLSFPTRRSSDLIPKTELQKFFEGMGYKPYFVEGDDPESVHQQLAGVLDTAVQEIKQIWGDALLAATPTRPTWPMIIFRSEEHTSELQSRFDIVC